MSRNSEVVIWALAVGVAHDGWCVGRVFELKRSNPAAYVSHIDDLVLLAGGVPLGGFFDVLQVLEFDFKRGEQRAGFHCGSRPFRWAQVQIFAFIPRGALRHNIACRQIRIQRLLRLQILKSLEALHWI